MSNTNAQTEIMQQARPHLDWIDWMKCAGIFIIVFGHVAGAPINLLTPPIFPKQLGVAFFVFVMGFSLANEHRLPRSVVLRRLFTMYFFGFAIALLLSVIHLITIGSITKSNYMPFLGGINVLFNFFPANPTTWFIGTYLHLLLLWAVALRRIRVTPWILAFSLLFEVIVRTVLICKVGNYVAYMLFPNWLTVFMLGIFWGRVPDAKISRLTHVWLPACVTILLVLAWFNQTVSFGKDFPFRMIDGFPQWPGAAAVSLMVSLLYLSFSILLYSVTRRLLAPSWVKFFARNTVIIFIAHMPVFYALQGWLSIYFQSYAPQAFLQLMVCLFGLSLVSELVMKLVKPERLREHFFRHFALEPAIGRIDQSGS